MKVYKGPAIQTHALTRWFGNKSAVDHLDLTVPQGACHAIVGTNGAGKTTLMRMLACTLVPTSGQVELFGRDSRDRVDELKAKIGVVPQGMTLDTELPVRETLTTFARYYGLTRQDAARRADALLDLVGLGEETNARVMELSGGMQRRLLVARSMLNHPKLLLLDEPTSGLDPAARLMIWDRLLALRSEGTTVIVTTHYLEEVQRSCDSLTVLSAGQAVLSATPSEVTERCTYRYAVELPSHIPYPSQSVPRFPSAGQVVRLGERVLILTNEPKRLVSDLASAGVEGDGIAERSVTFEDALLALTLPGSEPSPDGPTIMRAVDLATAITRSDARLGRTTRTRPSFRQAKYIWLRNATLFSHTYRTTFVPNFFEPVVIVVGLGLGLGRYVEDASLGQPYVKFLAPSLLAVSVMNGAIFEVTYNIFLRLHYTRMYDAVVTTPVSPASIVLGELMWSVTRSTAYGLMFLALSSAFGFVDSPRTIIAPVFFPLIGLVFACLGILFTSVVAHIGVYSYFYTLFLVPMTLFSGIYYPTDDLPGPARMLVWFSPLYHAAELLRPFFDEKSNGVEFGHAAWLLLLAVALLPATLNSLDRRLVP